jgi:hypothetical protein
VSQKEFIGTPMPIGHFLYVGMTRQSQRSLRVFDLSSNPVGRETAVLEIDRVSPVPPGETGNFPFDVCLKGSHLYVNSGSALTAIDVGNPAQPVVTSTLELYPLWPLGFVFPHPRPSNSQHPLA